MDTSKPNLPYFIKGTIIKGFGRGSKELGIPTANLPEEIVKQLPEDINLGVYCGFASVDNSEVYKMVMSIGWNPFYNNTVKSMETHILHSFDSDLYDRQLSLAIVGYIREERNFDGLDALIAEINNDIAIAKRELDKPDYDHIRNSPFFLDEMTDNLNK